MAREYILCDNVGVLFETWYSDDTPDPVGVYWALRGLFPTCNQVLIGPVMYANAPHDIRVIAGGNEYIVTKNLSDKWEVLREDGSFCAEVLSRKCAITYALKVGNRLLVGVPRGPHSLPDYGSENPVREATKWTL